MADIPFNDPFYFALPNPSPTVAVDAGARHIEHRFGIVGKAEVVGHEPAFTLCRLTDVVWASRKSAPTTSPTPAEVSL